MTVKQFLTMTSGLDLPELGKDGHVDGAFFDKFHNAPDRVAFVLGCPIKAAQDVDELLKNYIIPSAVSSSPTEPDDKEDQHLKELTKPIHM